MFRSRGGKKKGLFQESRDRGFETFQQILDMFFVFIYLFFAFIWKYVVELSVAQGNFYAFVAKAMVTIQAGVSELASRYRFM